MKQPRLLTVALFVVMASKLGVAQTDQRLKVYVAAFASDSVESGLMRNVTREADSLLTETNRYTVLERLEASRLASELQNEADLTRNPQVLNSLRQLGAQAVLFGRVEDDAQSGEYVFYVSLIRLNGAKEWARDLPLRHGLMNDRASRRAVLKDLIDPPHTSTPGAQQSAGSSHNVPRQDEVSGGECQAHAVFRDESGTSKDAKMILQPPSALCMEARQGSGVTVELELCGGKGVAIRGIKLTRESRAVNGSNEVSSTRVRGKLFSADGQLISNIQLPGLTFTRNEVFFPAVDVSKIVLSIGPSSVAPDRYFERVCSVQVVKADQ